MKSSKNISFFALFLSFILIVGPNVANGQNNLKLANIDNFQLESGEIIKECRIGYRTFGKLNAQESNAILYPTWFGGKSEHIANLIGPTKLVDSTKYYIIAVDALGNGVSSSPSNSNHQPGEKFPAFTIRDMVNAQYQLLTEKLTISHLYAIIGGSMGGMQTFEWIVSYPEFMDKAVPYVGTPKLTSYDLLLWQTEWKCIEMGQQYNCPEDSILKMVAMIQSLAMQTPQYRVRHTPVDKFSAFLSSTFQNYANNFIAEDWQSQLRAMMAHDISVPFDSSMNRAAATVQADVFVIVSKQDHVVNPTPALKFANLIHAKTMVLDNDCGHLAVGCEMERVAAAIRKFLEAS